MKRLICLLLVLVLLAGCAASGGGEQDSDVSFYYRGTDGDYFSELGAMGVERRTLEEDQKSVDVLMALYLEGPVAPELTSPFPKGLHLIRTEAASREITLVFDDSLAALTGIGLRLACACIARTLWEYGGYETVTIQTESIPLDGEEAIVLQPAELVLEDHSAGQPNALVRLYFADTQNRFLIEEQRTAPIGDDASLPDYILRSLIDGPQSEGLRSTIPKGTMLLNVSVVDRVCLVNFSAEFLQNRPRDALAERMTVFSVVNSLTQLDEVDSVEILAEGSSIGRYYKLDLSRELVRDESVIGPVRSGVGEFDATLYLCLEDDDHLNVFPMRVQETADQSRAASVIEALCSFEPRNGYRSPAREHIELNSVQLKQTTLRIEYTTKEQFAGEERTTMLRSIIATALALPDAYSVEISEDGMAFNLGGGQWTPDASWYHDLPEDADDSFFLCRELIPGYLDGITGVYQTPQGYYVDDKDVEAFDESFPPKKKLKLPGRKCSRLLTDI